MDDDDDFFNIDNNDNIRSNNKPSSNLYNFDEFVAYNEKEVNDYNASNQSVTILSSELVDNKAKVVIQYLDDDAYYDLNKKSLYYGRADKAKGVGYSLVNLVKTVEDGKVLSQAQWNEMTSEQVIVLSESMNVVTPSKIIYVGSGVELTGEKNNILDKRKKQHILSLIH